MGDDADAITSDGPPCPDCGAEVDPTDVYCSSCGAKCRITDSDDEEADEASGPGESRAAFRRRVHDKVAEGWEIDHDEGDSVVLVDRSLGSAGIHVLLFFLTGGLGNAVYAAYKYYSDADRTVLRRDETASLDVPAEANGRSSVKYTAGGLALMLLGALIAASDGLELASLLIGWYFVVIGAYLVPQVRDRFGQRHSLSTFGKTRSTDQSVVEDTDKPCSVCMGPIDQGIERTYKQEQVFAGIPLYTVESGTNHYCRDCANGEIEDVGSERAASEGEEAVADGVEREREPE